MAQQKAKRPVIRALLAAPLKVLHSFVFFAIQSSISPGWDSVPGKAAGRIPSYRVGGYSLCSALSAVNPALLCALCVIVVTAFAS
jgi:hypothetical protein